jgi:hypothetical protein
MSTVTIAWLGRVISYADQNVHKLSVHIANIQDELFGREKWCPGCFLQLVMKIQVPSQCSGGIEVAVHIFTYNVN